MNPKPDLTKIKELREKLSIPLNIAMELLNENDGDLVKCENEFHRNNINTICRIAECDEEVAEKHYRVCKYNVEKSIKKINEQLFFLTATPDEPIDKIGFILWAENESLSKYLSAGDKSLFIQTKDFEIVLDAFESEFPIPDRNNGEIQECFDPVSHNIFSNKTSRKIVDNMSKIRTSDRNTELFIRELIKWFHVRLRYADEIIIYGNL